MNYRKQLRRYRVLLAEKYRLWKNRNKPAATLAIKSSKHVYKMRANFPKE